MVAAGNEEEEHDAMGMETAPQSSCKLVKEKER
jgi:hypothetical protein